MKKRDDKFNEKKSVKPMHTTEDKELIKQAKNKKREKRRENAKTEDDFDALFKSYEQKLIKRLKLDENVVEKGKPFEEVDVSD